MFHWFPMIFKWCFIDFTRLGIDARQIYIVVYAFWCVHIFSVLMSWVCPMALACGASPTWEQNTPLENVTLNIATNVNFGATTIWAPSPERYENANENNMKWKSKSCASSRSHDFHINFISLVCQFHISGPDTLAKAPKRRQGAPAVPGPSPLWGPKVWK